MGEAVDVESVVRRLIPLEPSELVGETEPLEELVGVHDLAPLVRFVDAVRDGPSEAVHAVGLRETQREGVHPPRPGELEDAAALDVDRAAMGLGASRSDVPEHRKRDRPLDDIPGEESQEAPGAGGLGLGSLPEAATPGPPHPRPRAGRRRCKPPGPPPDRCPASSHGSAAPTRRPAGTTPGWMP